MRAGGPPRCVADVVALLEASGRPDTVLDESLASQAEAALGRGTMAWASLTARGVVRELVAPGQPLASLREIIVRRGAEAFLVDVLLDLSGLPTVGIHTEPTHRAVVREFLSHDLPMGAVVGELRRSQQYLAGALLDTAVGGGATPALLNELTLGASRCMDRFIASQVVLHAEEQGRLTDRGSERRRLVESLVRGDELDTDPAGRKLGVQLRQLHVAVAARPGDPVSLGAVYRAIDGAARALGAASVLRHEGSDGSVWSWFSRPEGAPGRPLRLAVPGIGVGIGSAQPGATGFRRSLIEALDALRVAEGATPPGTVRHEDVPLAAVLSQDRERAAWFVTAVLGPLAENDAEMRELRECLREYFRSGERLGTAAARLRVHRNTVADRLTRITDLIGRPLTGDTADLQSALVLLDEFAGLLDPAEGVVRD